MSPTITVTSLFRQLTECMRSGHFLQKLLLDRPWEHILSVNRVKLFGYNDEYSDITDETEGSPF